MAGAKKAASKIKSKFSKGGKSASSSKGAKKLTSYKNKSGYGGKF